MKIKYVLLSLISFLLVFSTLVLADEADRSAVAVEIDPYNQGVTVGFDLLGIRGYRAGDWARTSPGILKIITYPLDYVGYMAVEHPFQTVGVTLLALEATTQWPSDTIKSAWDSITGNDDDDDDDDADATATPTPTPKPGTEQTGQNNTSVNGDNNTVTQTTTYNINVLPTPTPVPTGVTY